MTSRSRRVFAATVASVAAVVLVFSASLGSAFGATHNTVRPAQRNQTWVSAWDWGTWVYSGPPCNCYYHPALAYDSLNSNPALLQINSTLKLAPIKPPKGIEFAGPISVSTYGGAKIIGANAYQVVDSTHVRFLHSIAAPAGADGIRIAMRGGQGTAPVQVVSFTKGGVAIGSQASENGGTAIDIVVKRKKLSCSNNLIDPPIVLETGVTDGKSQAQPGRPQPWTCSIKAKELSGHVTLIK